MEPKPQAQQRPLSFFLLISFSESGFFVCGQPLIPRPLLLSVFIGGLSPTLTLGLGCPRPLALGAFSLSQEGNAWQSVTLGAQGPTFLIYKRGMNQKVLWIMSKSR